MCGTRSSYLTRFVAVAATLAWLGSGVAAQAVPRQSTAKELPRAPLCAKCTARVDTIAELRAPKAGLSHGHVESLATDRLGRIFATFTELEGQVIVFDPGGRFLQSLRLPDPDMAGSPLLSVSVDAEDSLYVVDGMHERIAVFGPRLNLVRTGSFKAGIVRAIVPLHDGTYFVSADIRRPETVGLPLHIVSKDGSVRSSFGAPDTAFAEAAVGTASHAVTVTPDGGIWSTPHHTVQLRRWDGTVPRDQVGFEGGAPGSWTAARPTVSWARIAPAVMDLRGDACGRVWIISRVPSNASWEEAGLDSIEVSVGEWRHSVRFPQLLSQTAIDVVEPRKRLYIASYRLPLSIRGMTSDTTALAMSRDEGGSWHTLLVRLRLEPAEALPKCR